MCIFFQHYGRLRGATANKTKWNCQTEALYLAMTALLLELENPMYTYVKRQLEKRNGH